MKYKDEVTVECHTGYFPPVQLVSCDHTGKIQPPVKKCDRVECSELYVKKGKIQCTNKARENANEQMVFGSCDLDRDGELNPWETFQYPNEFQIVCEPGFEYYSEHPEWSNRTKCTMYGNYTRYPECKDVNECDQVINVIVVFSHTLCIWYWSKLMQIAIASRQVILSGRHWVYRALISATQHLPSV